MRVFFRADASRPISGIAAEDQKHGRLWARLSWIAGKKIRNDWGFHCV